MPILAIIIILAAICNFFLGLIILLKDPSKRLNKTFGGFCLAASLWALTNFLLIVRPSVFWLQSTYGTGALVGTFSIFWTTAVCETRLSRFKTILITIFGIFFFLTPFLYFSYPEGNISKAYETGVEVSSHILYFLAFTGYMFTVIFAIIYTLVRGYKKTAEVKKKQIGYVLTGISLHVATVSLVSFVLPLFKISKWAPLDSSSSLFYVVFSFLAIIRFRLFEIKVILTEILVTAIGLVLLLMPFLVDNLQLKILTGGVFIFFCLLGYLLIRSALKEVRQKEILEQKVRERTRDLEIAKNLAEQKTAEVMTRKEELEKFYKLTIGRELKMVELKEKIKSLGQTKKNN